MKPDLPPRLDSEPSKRRSLGPLWAVGLIALALIVAHLVELWQVPLPQCTTRSLTGLPCPFCGSTRTMMAAARGDFVRAAALNPLMFLGLVALLAWFGVWAVERMTGHRLPATTGQQLRRIRWGWVIAAAIITNWIYLWLTLP